ncbi:MAG: hypothetical protein AAGA46_00630 [Cyanobacteria bacterium P01_F01_bin.13]
MQTVTNQETSLFNKSSRKDSELRTVTDSHIFQSRSVTLDQESSSSNTMSSTLYRLPRTGFRTLDPSEIRASNREIARANYRGKEEEELNKLASERSELIMKKISVDIGLTRSEEKRLKYIDWQIDRIEDSLIGDSLDDLEAFVNGQNALGSDIKLFAKQVEALLRHK